MIAEIIFGILTASFLIQVFKWLFKPKPQETDNTQYELPTNRIRDTFIGLVEREREHNSIFIGEIDLGKLLPVEIQELHKVCLSELEALSVYEKRLFAVVTFTRTSHKYDHLHTPEMIDSDYKEWLQKTITILDIWDTVHLTGWTDQLSYDYDTNLVERMGIEERIKNYVGDPMLNMLEHEQTRY